MKRKLVAAFGAVLALAVFPMPGSAHHGAADYSGDKPVEIKNAAVTRVIWTNPHTLILFDAKDDKGNLVHWVTEAGSPSSLINKGWIRNSLHPGDTITVYLYVSKAGTPVGRLSKVVTADGKTLPDYESR